MDTPIFNELRNERQFMCQVCTDAGKPYGWFICSGDDGLCDQRDVVMFRDVSLAPDDVEWVRSDDDDLKDALFDDHQFELFVVREGLPVALELVTALHRKVANQLIRRAVSDRQSSRWASAAIHVCRQAKWRRRQLRRWLAAEVGRSEVDAPVEMLSLRYPRAEWGSDA